LSSLMHFGGFPEPFIKQSSRALGRWQILRKERIIQEDIREIESVRDLPLLEILADLLPQRVSSPLSLNSLREDLQVAHNTIALWLNIFEKFYLIFRIPPFTSTAVRSLRKEQKVYLWDWSEIEDEGARFENLIASHLLKFCHCLRDADGVDIELRYLRDRDQREVDFVVLVKKKPWFCVEAKLSDTTPAKSITYFSDRLKIPFRYQVINKSGVDKLHDRVRVVSAEKFLWALK